MNIRDIPKEGGRVNIRKDSEWFMNMLGDADIDIEFLNEEMTATIDIHLHHDKAVVIEGELHADVVLRCVKCLESFRNLINRHFSVTLEPYDASLTTRHAVSMAELDTEVYLNDEFDPDAVVFEQIMLSLPMYPLCRHDCRGLCPYCGINLNENADHKCRQHEEDSALSRQLRKIKNNL